MGVCAGFVDGGIPRREVLFSLTVACLVFVVGVRVGVTIDITNTIMVVIIVGKESAKISRTRRSADIERRTYPP